ncbi:MAG: response regulator transcription factor [Bacteroidales bacterium]|nr:response regulator transcription factor [Bacteroidales bacterium]
MSNKVKVAIVDDHEIFRNGLRMVVDSLDYTEVIAEAPDGMEFLKIIESKQPDIVLMDIKMPVMDGIEATAIAVKKFPKLNIIALTMFGDEKHLQEMIEAGAKGFLLKNIKKSELDIAMRSIMEGKNYYSGELLGFFTKKYFGNNPASESGLTKKEMEVLVLSAKGYTSKEIAKQLYVCSATVNAHKTNILSKTNSKNVAELLIYAIKNKLVNLSDLGIQPLETS